MLTPQPYLTIVRLEREAQEHQPRYLREFEEHLREAPPTPVPTRRREHPRLRGLALGLRAFLF